MLSERNAKQNHPKSCWWQDEARRQLLGRPNPRCSATLLKHAAPGAPSSPHVGFVSLVGDRASGSGRRAASWVVSKG